MWPAGLHRVFLLLHTHSVNMEKATIITTDALVLLIRANCPCWLLYCTWNMNETKWGKHTLSNSKIENCTKIGRLSWLCPHSSRFSVLGAVGLVEMNKLSFCTNSTSYCFLLSLLSFVPSPSSLGSKATVCYWTLLHQHLAALLHFAAVMKEMSPVWD